ncbi:hypothetical protein HF313_19575 [Massilia atriviolacea]|uniref:Uncharacterized protein n=1 Tax=Massilia atriviolacea TaxID=2495579 RepID=A0A430HSJ7_9BURK|nr:hypothetical protein [Massilia atriviolacea]RSZ60496.1 hypothetical protein EJB06_05125 [Massilia atriviolacea]
MNLIDGNDGAALLFDESKVPVEVIAVGNDEAAGLDPADFEVIGEKVSYRLNRRPGSYVILRYVRPVIRLRADQALRGVTSLMPGRSSRRKLTRHGTRSPLSSRSSGKFATMA